MLNLSELYESWDGWEHDFLKLEEKLNNLRALKDVPLSSAANLVERYKHACELWELQGRLHCFAKLRRDENMSDTFANSAAKRVAEAISLASAETAWFNLDILRIQPSRLLSWCEESTELATYRAPLLEIIRGQEHQLDEKSEHLLAIAEPAMQASLHAYDSLCSSILADWKVELSDGTSIALSTAKYRAMMEECSLQNDRRRVASSYYSKFREYGQVFAELYSGAIQRTIFQAKSRKHRSSLASVIFRESIPEQIIRDLIIETRSLRRIFSRYFEIRKSMLGIAEYHLYDNSAAIPFFKPSSISSTDLKEIVCSSAKLVGAAYAQSIRDLFKDGHIAYSASQGKFRGAYCLSAYGIKPFVLANLIPSLSSAQTIAHECGHAMHALLADNAQPFQCATASSVVSEAIALVHERMLLRQLELNDGNEDVAKSLRLRAIDSAFTSFFTQVMFLDFELRAHEHAENGGGITEDFLCSIYGQVAMEYLSGGAELDEFYKWTWARVSLFHRRPFYSASYALSYAASARLFKGLVNHKDPARNEARSSFVRLLERGGTRPPLDLLEEAGARFDARGMVSAVEDEVDANIRWFGY